MAFFLKDTYCRAQLEYAIFSAKSHSSIKHYELADCGPEHPQFAAIVS